MCTSCLHQILAMSPHSLGKVLVMCFPCTGPQNCSKKTIWTAWTGWTKFYMQGLHACVHVLIRNPHVAAGLVCFACQNFILMQCIKIGEA